MLLDQQVSVLRDSILLKKDCPPLPKLNINFSGVNQDFLAYRPIFESYLKVFLENGFYPNPIIEFLELEDPYKTKCIKTFHKKFLVDENVLNEEVGLVPFLLSPLPPPPSLLPPSSSLFPPPSSLLLNLIYLFLIRRRRTIKVLQVTQAA